MYDRASNDKKYKFKKTNESTYLLLFGKEKFPMRKREQ